MGADLGLTPAGIFGQRLPDGRLVILASGSYYQKVFDLSLSNANRDRDPSLATAVVRVSQAVLEREFDDNDQKRILESAAKQIPSMLA